jgi:enoyl-CoA hydratase/carnithine racemase
LRYSAPVKDTGYETIEVAVHGRVAVLSLHRPELMNAISTAMRAELRHALEELQADADIGAAVLTGGGDKAFSAGMDLREFSKLLAQTPVAEVKRIRVASHEGIAAFDKPIVAAVNGLAMGGGVELALQCDVILAADEASFAFPEVRRGLMPGNGGTQRLSRRIGRARALEMILTGRSVSAQEALAIGLVEFIVPRAGLLAGAIELASQMGANAPLAVRNAKAAVVRGAEMTLEEGLRLEQDLAAFLYTTEDAREGPIAFQEKRPPSWKGR